MDSGRVQSIDLDGRTVTLATGTGHAVITVVAGLVRVGDELWWPEGTGHQQRTFFNVTRDHLVEAHLEGKS